jgi:hypothetical protein
MRVVKHERERTHGEVAHEESQICHAVFPDLLDCAIVKTNGNVPEIR